jgi:hypothetical protein
VDRRWWAHTFDEAPGVSSGRIVDMAPEEKVDTEGLWRRLQDLLTVEEEPEAYVHNSLHLVCKSA